MASLPGLLASEAREQAVHRAYRRDAGVLSEAVQAGDGHTLCTLAKFVPYAELMAAAQQHAAPGRPAGNARLSTEPAGPAGTSLQAALSRWGAATCTAWAAACSRDQQLWERTRSAALLVGGRMQPAEHWKRQQLGDPSLIKPSMRTCYMCEWAGARQGLTGQAGGQAGAGRGRHSKLWVQCAYLQCPVDRFCPVLFPTSVSLAVCPSAGRASFEVSPAQPSPAQRSPAQRSAAQRRSAAREGVRLGHSCLSHLYRRGHPNCTAGPAAAGRLDS